MIEAYKKVTITCETVENVSVDELSRFFYYLNNIYKIIYFQETERASKFYHLRKLKAEERLRISIIRKESPLEFVILIPISIGLLKISELFITNLKLIRDWKIDREIKELQAEQLRLRNELLRHEIDKIIKLNEIGIIIVEESEYNANP